MKVLIINGSPHNDGCIKEAIDIVKNELNNEDIETVEVNLGTQDIRGCIDCKYCKENHKCAFNDIVNEVSEI